jgi:hypothetical protein
MVLLTVEIDVNGSQRAQIKVFIPYLSRFAVPIYIRDFCFALAALIGPVQNIAFLTVHNFYSFVLMGHQAGQAAVLGRLSLSMSLWLQRKLTLKNLFKFVIIFNH